MEKVGEETLGPMRVGWLGNRWDVRLTFWPKRIGGRSRREA